MSFGVLQRSSALLQRGDVVEATEPARDVARRQRLAFERRDDADHVLRAARRDDDDLKLLGREPERLRPQLPPVAFARSDDVGRHGHAVDLARRDDEERDRVDRQQRSRREHRTLHALLAAAVDERLEVREVLELRLVRARSWRRSATASPTCAITTPISPAGTWTHGNFLTPKSGQSLNRKPGMSSSAW